MNKFKKLFMLLFVALFAVTLFGCDNSGDDPVEQEKPAPTSITIQLDAYDGASEEEAYVLIGGDNMVLSAEVNEGADPGIQWTVDANGKVEIVTTEDNTVEIKAVKAGNTTVTCTSTKDTSVFATKNVVVVSSTDATAVLIAAKEEVIAALPDYTTGEFKLPVPSDDNVTATYRNSGSVEYANGTFKETYTEDLTVAINVTLKYKTSVIDFKVEKVKLVDSLTKNSFEAVKYANAKILEDMNAKAISTDDSNILIVNASLTSFYTDATTALPAIKLISSFTEEEAGKPVTVLWESVTTSDPVQIKTNADGTYYMTYSKPLADTYCDVNCSMYSGSTPSIIKFRFIAAGYTPEEVLDYAIDKLNFPLDNAVVTKTYLKVPVSDTTKKFTKLKIVWTSLDTSVITFSESQSIFKLVDTSYTGTVQIKAVLYYNMKTQTALVDKVDENGNVVKDEDGKVVQEEVEQIICDWSKEVTLNIEFK